MKKSMVLVGSLVIATCGFAQTNTDNQNADFAISRSKYIQAKDSLVRYESGTMQETYKAYDYMEELQAKKDAKIAFKRELKLARARRSSNNSNDYGSGYPYSPGNSGYYNGYTYPSSGNVFFGNLSSFVFSSLPVMLGYILGKN